jgi:Ca-activated chloride channel homolog
MIFTAPLGLLALLAIPAIVAIHLFRRRFPVRPVAGLFLWQIGRQVPEGGGKISKLPITTSLLLELLAALALALIIAGARLSSASDTAHLVVLLDDSASMGAVNGRGEGPRDRAIARVFRELDRLGSRARVTLVASGERPSVLAGPAAFAVDARRALEKWRPEAPHHSLALGLRLARELAGDTGRLMVMTDALPGPRPEDGVLWVALGESLANVGIIGAERTLSPDEGRGAVSLTLANNSDALARRRVHVTAGGKDVLIRELEVKRGVSSLTLPIPAGLPAVRVVLSNDAMARDNEVLLAEPRPRIVGVENRLPEGRGRDALTRALGAIGGVTPATESAHLIFAEAGSLDQPPGAAAGAGAGAAAGAGAGAVAGAWRVGFGRAPAAWIAKGESRDSQDFIGPFVLEKRHPLLLGITFGGVVWTGAAPLAPGAVRPVVSAGDQVLIGLPPLTGSARTESDVFFNLDLDRTNLIRSPDWPILVSNLIEMRRESLPGPERWNYRVGEWIRVRLARDPKGPLRMRCGTVERVLPPGRQVEFIAPSPGGLLQILEGGGIGGNEVALFELGVNFLDESEANLRDRMAGNAGQFGDVGTLRAESGPESNPLFWVLLTIAGTAIVGNWCLLPRMSVQA